MDSKKGREGKEQTVVDHNDASGVRGIKWKHMLGERKEWKKEKEQMSVW